ncbi:MAG: RNA 2',3'-cyclic phosphodiesterase [Planctomycetota bacterium]
MTKTRTFVAVELSHSVRQRAGDLIQRLQASAARVGWVSPENMHITLKFLGEQTDDDIATICQAVMEAAKTVAPFEFNCHGAGAFPSHTRPRTVWIGVREGTDALRQLHQRVEDQLWQRGYKKEKRAFHPHVTIGRVRRGGAGVETLGDLITAAEQFQAGTVVAEEVVVFGSHLGRGGPRYQALARAPLEGQS